MALSATERSPSGGGFGGPQPGWARSLGPRYHPWHLWALLCPVEGSRCPAAGGGGRTGRKGLSSGPEEREEEVNRLHMWAMPPGLSTVLPRAWAASRASAGGAGGPPCEQQEKVPCWETRSFIFLAGSGAEGTTQAVRPLLQSPGSLAPYLGCGDGSQWCTGSPGRAEQSRFILSL